MPRFFLNVEYFDGAALSDVDGAEYADTAMAISEATKDLRELAAEVIRAESSRVPKKITVADAAGHELGAVKIEDIIPRTMRSAC